VPPVLKGQPVRPALLVHRASPAHKVPRDSLGPMALQGPRVQPALRVPKA